MRSLQSRPESRNFLFPFRETYSKKTPHSPYRTVLMYIKGDNNVEDMADCGDVIAIYKDKFIVRRKNRLKQRFWIYNLSDYSFDRAVDTPWLILYDETSGKIHLSLYHLVHHENQVRKIKDRNSYTQNDMCELLPVGANPCLRLNYKKDQLIIGKNLIITFPTRNEEEVLKICVSIEETTVKMVWNQWVSLRSKIYPVWISRSATDTHEQFYVSCIDDGSVNVIKIHQASDSNSLSTWEVNGKVDFVGCYAVKCSKELCDIRIILFHLSDSTLKVYKFNEEKELSRWTFSELVSVCLLNPFQGPSGFIQMYIRIKGTTSAIYVSTEKLEGLAPFTISDFFTGSSSAPVWPIGRDFHDKEKEDEDVHWGYRKDHFIGESKKNIYLVCFKKGPQKQFWDRVMNSTYSINHGLNENVVFNSVEDDECDHNNSYKYLLLPQASHVRYDITMK